MDRLEMEIFQSTKDLKSKSKIHKLVCIECRAEVETVGLGDEFLRDNYQSETICSRECYDTQKKKDDDFYFNKRIKGIPVKFREFSAEGNTVEENFGLNLFISGKSGAGKTVLASSIAKECIKRRKDFKWISFPSFLMELQNLYKKDHSSETPFEVAERMANFNGVLIVDDLGAEKITDWVRQITYYIFNEREQRNLPIVVTSNFSLEEISQQIDVRISSRIAGMCKLIKLSGRDRRIESQDKKWVIGEPKKLFTENLDKY